MEKVKSFTVKYFWVWVAVLFIPASWALVIPGFYGASDDLHIAWLYEMHKTILMGQIPPRFVPDLSFGFGYPLFEFVFPLPFYIAEIFHLLGFSLVDSIKILFLLSIPMSGLFMYFFLREFSPRALSLAGSILYIYAPYRAVDLYIRGAIGEILSFVFLPAILLSILKLTKSQDLRWVGIGALSLASLVLSHNITAYMFAPFILLFILFQSFSTLSKKAFLIRSFLMIFLGFLISMYFWMPAILESKLMKYDTVFNFADHFPTISQLVTPYWGYGASVPGPGDGMSFFLGIGNILVLILGFVIGIGSWDKLKTEHKMVTIWAFLCILCAIFLMNHRSSFLWNSLPLLPYFQFPWRFLILTTFAVPVLAVLFDRFNSKTVIATLIIALTIITSGSYFRPQDFLGRMDEYYLNRYIPTPVASDEYLQIQEEYLRLPKAAEKRPDQNYPLVTINNAAVKTEDRINDLDTVLRANSLSGSTINYSKYFFPGWEAEIDGQKVEIAAGKPFGQITFNVPAGYHIIRVKFEETNYRMALNAVSLASFLVSLGLAKFLWLR